MLLKRRLIKRTIFAIALDIVLASGLVAGDYFISYRFPHVLASADVKTSAQNSDLSAGIPMKQASIGTDPSATALSNTFSEHFSDSIISTDTVYKSKDISIEITKKSYDSQYIDHTDSGKHEKYGSKIAYTLADIYVSDVTLLRTAFAQDTYGVGYTAKLTDMSAGIQSVLAINGDSYSNSSNRNSGTIIRNGTAYRMQLTKEAFEMAKNWYPVIDYLTCIECGTCVAKCPHGVYDLSNAPSPRVTNSGGRKSWDYSVRKKKKRHCLHVHVTEMQWKWKQKAWRIVAVRAVQKELEHAAHRQVRISAQ